MTEQQPSIRQFFVLWGGQTLSLVGTNAVQFALVWWLTIETGSPAVLATATLLGLLPQVVLGPFIGALIDRWNRKQVMLYSDALVAAASLALAILYAAGVAQTNHVLALLLVRALGAAFHVPAMLASTSLMVPERHLTNIQGLNQGAQGLLLIVGAPLGALLVASLSMTMVMLVDVVTAIVAITPLLFVAAPQPKQAEVAEAESSAWSEMMDGFRYLRKRTAHLTLLFLSAAVNLLLVPAFSLLPLLVLERLSGDASQLGWIHSAFGVGMLAGGILLGVWGGFTRRVVTTLVGLVALGVTVLAVGITPDGAFWWALSSMLAVGFVVPFTNGPIQAILQSTVPAEFQGRVFTLVGSLAGATAPIGLLFAAPMAELLGVGVWYLAGGAMCVAMGITGFLSPHLLKIETPSEDEDVSVAV